MCDPKIASSLKKIIQNSNIKKRVYLEDRKDGPVLLGRQIGFMIYEHCRVTGTHVAILDYPDLVGVTSHDDDVQGFDTRYGTICFINNLNKMRIRGHDQIKTVLTSYEQDFEQHNSQPRKQQCASAVWTCS